MAKIHQNSRLICSITLLVFGLLSAGPVGPQDKASSQAPPEADRQANPIVQGKAKARAADAEVALTSPETPEEVRKVQIEADTKRLYILSAELRAEVAKTYKESLSLTVLKKAEEVEKLARSLKTLMTQDAASKR